MEGVEGGVTCSSSSSLLRAFRRRFLGVSKDGTVTGSETSCLEEDVTNVCRRRGLLRRSMVLIVALGLVVEGTSVKNAAEESIREIVTNFATNRRPIIRVFKWGFKMTSSLKQDGR